MLVKELHELLGAGLVAYLGGVKETRAVRQWVEGTRRIASGRTWRGCGWALPGRALLAERDSASVVQAWFTGLHPALAD